MSGFISIVAIARLRLYAHNKSDFFMPCSRKFRALAFVPAKASEMDKLELLPRRFLNQSPTISPPPFRRVIPLSGTHAAPALWRFVLENFSSCVSISRKSNYGEDVINQNTRSLTRLRKYAEG